MLKIFRKVLFLKSFVRIFFLFFSEEIKLNNCQKIWLRDFQWLVTLLCRSSESVIYLIPKVTLKILLKLFLRVYLKGFDQKLQNILKVILLCCIFFLLFTYYGEKNYGGICSPILQCCIFLLFTYYGEQKKFTMEYVPILSYIYSEKRKNTTILCY